MPEEIAIIAILSIIMGTITVIAVTRSVIGYLRDKNSVSQDSVGTSELRQLMLEAVEQATAPLYQRIDALEAQLHQPRLPEASSEHQRPEAREAEPR